MDQLVLVLIMVAIIIAAVFPIAIVFPRAIKKRNLVHHNNELNRLRKKYEDGELTLDEYREK
jgi:uncharacterized membrane protein